jgi:hypothetical protein
MAISKKELTRRIVRCIGIWETNRGGDDPQPKESALDTVAGVHASMATIEQATMPYAVGAMLDHSSLRALAVPPLNVTELKAALEICKAVATLVKSVAASAAAGTSAPDFIAAKQAMISASGLRNADVTTMFEAVTLKKKIDDLNARVANGQLTLDQAVARVPASERLGLGAASIKSYIRKPKNWGENRAGWQRKAADRMANDVGARINAVCISSLGTALAFPVNEKRVTARLGGNPVPGTKEALKPIVKAVAQLNNPNETNYGTNVWNNYDRLF